MNAQKVILVSDIRDCAVSLGCGSLKTMMLKRKFITYVTLYKH